jgi:hypothetical protein
MLNIQDGMDGMVTTRRCSKWQVFEVAGVRSDAGATGTLIITLYNYLLSYLGFTFTG